MGRLERLRGTSLEVLTKRSYGSKGETREDQIFSVEPVLLMPCRLGSVVNLVDYHCLGTEEGSYHKD